MASINTNAASKLLSGKTSVTSLIDYFEEHKEKKSVRIDLSNSGKKFNNLLPYLLRIVFHQVYSSSERLV
jgi:hypothetical protein